MSDDTADPNRDAYDEGAAPRRTRAIVHRGRWPGLIWALPIAALLIAGWLALHALTHPGIDVILDTPTAQGVRTGDTHVTYNGFEIGSVSKIALAPDGKTIRLTLTIDGSKKGLFRVGTQVWIVGANPSFTNIASLRAAVAGPSVGVEPGPGEPRRHFAAIPDAPIVSAGTQGKHFKLIARDLVSITPGTSIYTHGVKAGVVAGITPRGEEGFEVDAFVSAPYAQLVTPATHFWDASAFQLTRGAGGLQARLTSPSIAALGGVAFETPEQIVNRPPASEGTAFRLYADSGSASAAPVGPETRYQIALTGDVGGLLPGAPVQLRGYIVGRVIDTHFTFDPDAGVIRTPTTIALDGTRLDVPATRQGVDNFVATLARHGMRAELTQSPPFVGSYLVTLNPDSGGRARLRPGSPYPWIPAAPGGGSLLAKADSIMAKVDALPLAQIGSNLRALTGNLTSLTGSPELRQSLRHLNATLATLDATTQQAAPEIGPMIKSLRQTADQAQKAAQAASNVLGGAGGGSSAQDANLPAAIRQLTEAARSIRSLTDYLSRHPEALLRGKKEKK